MDEQLTVQVDVPTLAYGDSGPWVYRLQLELLLAGSDPGTIDGDWGDNTQRAVDDFCRTHALTPGGLFGRREWIVLFNGGI